MAQKSCPFFSKWILGKGKFKTKAISKISKNVDNYIKDFHNDHFYFSQCTAKSDTSMYGTCLTSSECSSKSGTSDGNCAAGFGVCCVFTCVLY